MTALPTDLGAADAPQSRADAPREDRTVPSSTVEGLAEHQSLSFSDGELAQLPDGWRRDDHGSVVVFTCAAERGILTNVSATAAGCVLNAFWNECVPADLITVLRHAERAHQQLKAGAK